MKFTTGLLFFFLTTLTLASGQIYREYFGNSVAFSDNYMVQYTGSTLSVSTTDHLDNPAQNYTVNSTIRFALFLSNELIIFATDTTIYIIDPVTIQLKNTQPFLSERVYLIPLWQNNRLTFAMYPSSLTTLYYLDPEQNGQLTLIDSHYNVYQTYVLILGDGSILLADPGRFFIYATNGTTLYSSDDLPIIDGVAPTEYGIFALASGSFLEIYNSTSYESMNMTFGEVAITYCTMPMADRFLVFTNDYKISVFSFSPGNFPSSLPNIGNITLDPLTTMMYYIYLNDGLFAIPCANSTLLLYNVSKTSDFFYANIAVPNMYGWGPVSVMYLEDTLFAVLSQQMITIFDYSTGALIKTISLEMNGTFIFTTNLLQYTDGSFFVSYMDIHLEPYYLITCHYSCASCSGLGSNACSNCSSVRTLQEDLSCTCETTPTQSFMVSEPPFACGLNYEIDLSNLPNASSETTAGGSYPSPPFAPPPKSSSASLVASTQNVNTRGTGQDETYIHYLEAPNAGQNATIQMINVYMQNHTPIVYMLKLHGGNSQGKDSCSYIKSMTSSAVSASFSSDPIYYSSVSLSSYIHSDSDGRYVIPLYGLRGSTQYTLKVCVGLEGVDSSQTLNFATKNNNFKVAKFQFTLNQTVSLNLTQDLLCYLTTLTKIPSSRIYSKDGSQCNQIFFGVGSMQEGTYQIQSNGGRRRILDTTSDASSSNSVIVLFYGNPNVEGIDMSVDQAAYRLNMTGNEGLVFKDRHGNYIHISKTSYMGLAGLGTPTIKNNIVIDTTSDMITLSNIIISGTSGYIFAMLSTDKNSTIPTQDQIRSAALAGNSSGSEYNTSYFWYFASDTPVSIVFKGLSKGQECTIYYFATNEDLTNFAKYTNVHSKTVQTEDSMNPALLILIVVFSVILFILCAIIIMCCAIKKRNFGRRNMYRHNNVIDIKKAVKITHQRAVADIKLKELKKEKEELTRIRSDLEKASNNSFINTSNVQEVNDGITPDALKKLETAVKATENKILNFEQEKLCPQCGEHPKDLLLDCGHMFCSEKCGSALEECPFDKTIIRTKKKIFLS